VPRLGCDYRRTFACDTRGGSVDVIEADRRPSQSRSAVPDGRGV